MLQDLQWSTLAHRRKIQRLTVFHKAVEGYLSIPVRKLLHPVQCPTRRSHSKSIIELQPNKDSFKYSFIPRTVTDWNNLYRTISSTYRTRIHSNNNFNPSQTSKLKPSESYHYTCADLNLVCFTPLWGVQPYQTRTRTRIKCSVAVVDWVQDSVFHVKGQIRNRKFIVISENIITVWNICYQSNFQGFSTVLKWI